MSFYTGIGSRNTPNEILEIMYQFAKITPLTLRSGGANGADSAFELGAIETHKPMEIYLPWNGFNNKRADNRNYFLGNYVASHEIASKFHPAWNKLSPGAKKLHARNIHQVAGWDLNTPSEFVIAYTTNGELVGGTATALKAAEYCKIPIINLGIKNHLDQLVEYIQNQNI